MLPHPLHLKEQILKEWKCYVKRQHKSTVEVVSHSLRILNFVDFPLSCFFLLSAKLRLIFEAVTGIIHLSKMVVYEICLKKKSHHENDMFCLLRKKLD